jgi:S-adenosylmethionine decarboxylase
MTEINKKIKTEIGFNLLIDVYNVSSKEAGKKELLKLLKEILLLTKMIPVGKPIVKKISSPKYPWYGYSIVQILQESHIAIHTWYEYNYFALDIFSCKFFDHKKVLNFLKEKFPLAKIKYKLFKRDIKI